MDIQPRDDGGALSVDDVTKQGHALLQDFIGDQMKRDGNPSPPTLDHERPPGFSLNDWKEIGRAIQTMADILDKDTELKRKIREMSHGSRMEGFKHIVEEAFSDGKFSWTKVVLLFVVAYKLSVHALVGDAELINQLIKFTVDTIHDRVAAWIIGRGGWVAILKELRTWKCQVAVASGAVMAVAAAFYCGYRLGSSNP